MSPPLRDVVLDLIAEHHGGSVRQAAKRTGIPYSTLNDITSGHTPAPTSATLERIAQGFGMTSGDLLKLSEGDGDRRAASTTPAPAAALDRRVDYEEDAGDRVVRELSGRAVRKRMPPKERALAAVDDIFDNLPAYDDSQLQIVLAYLYELARETRDAQE